VNDVVRVTRVLKAAPQEVFDAWTDTHQLRQWLCPDPGEVGEVWCDPVVGGGYRLVMLFEHGAFVTSGEYLTVDPPHRLVFTWLADSTAGRPTQVTVTLRPEGDTTEMTITHERIPSREFGESAGSAWVNVLDKLDGVLADRR